MIPNIRHGPDAWKNAVWQWEVVDDHMGYALKDWPLAWYTGDNKRRFAAKHGQQRLVTEEYERCVPSSPRGRTRLRGFRGRC
jgi:hypothetical protein